MKNSSRKFKGSSANKHIENYCVLDLETTGIFISSAEIIEISAIKVRNNNVVEEFSTLINPQCHIPEEATAVNHITDEMVKDAPVLESIIEEFLSFVGEDVIVGYNNAGFDMNLIYDNVQEILGIPFKNDYLDILHAARRCIDGIENYKLETICKYYHLDTEGEHRALKDCYLTKAVYDNLYEDFGDSAFKSKRSKGSGCGVKFSAETLALQELNNILKDLLNDGNITLDEVDSLRFWVEEHRYLSGNYPFDKVFDSLDKVLEDGMISNAEREELKGIFYEVLDPVKSNSCHESIDSIVNKHVCLSGDFDYGTKSEFAKLIEEKGGVIDKTVKKTTDYVVVGSQGSVAWKAGNYGSKIQKVLDWNEKGMSIKIVEESTFLNFINDSVAYDNYSQSTNIEMSGDWKKSIQNALDKLVVEEKLPSNSLRLLANYGRNGKTITSYSVCICEPDYPTSLMANDIGSKSNVLNIKDNNTNLEIMVDKTRYGEIGSFDGAKIKEVKSDEKYIHLIVDYGSVDLLEYIIRNVRYVYANYVSKAASFGCCGQFNACSDAKKCLHPNKLYSKACTYRKHLENGRIFYGKNRNVD